jgi:hypothetical protein
MFSLVNSMRSMRIPLARTYAQAAAVKANGQVKSVIGAVVDVQVRISCTLCLAKELDPLLQSKLNVY